MRKVFSQLTPELLVVAGYGLGCFLLYLHLYPSLLPGETAKLLHPLHLLTNFFGGPYFSLPFGVIFFYLVYKGLSGLMEKWTGHGSKWQKEKSIWQNTIIYLSVLGVLSFLLSALVQLVSLDPDLVWTGTVTQKLMDMDLAIFGSYPIFVLNDRLGSHRMDSLTTGAYSQLFTLVGLLFLALLVSARSLLLRRFVLAFFLCALLAVPFWFLWPALSPRIMYQKNILKQEVPQDIAQGFAALESRPQLEAFLVATDRYWIDPNARRYPISSNPSLHLGWAVVVLGCTFAYSRLLGWILVPWFSLNALATVYTLQHFAVDAIFGLLLGIVALRLASLFLAIRPSPEGQEIPGVNQLIKADLAGVFFKTKHKSKP